MRGIVYAMGKEMAGPLAQANPLGDVAGMKLYQADETTVVCVCGIGKVHAAMGTQLLIDRFGVDEVYNAGVAGCFHDFPVGTLVVAHHCVQHDMDKFPARISSSCSAPEPRKMWTPSPRLVLPPVQA